MNKNQDVEEPTPNKSKILPGNNLSVTSVNNATKDNVQENVAAEKQSKLPITYAACVGGSPKKKEKRNQSATVLEIDSVNEKLRKKRNTKVRIAGAAMAKQNKMRINLSQVCCCKRCVKISFSN